MKHRFLTVLLAFLILALLPLLFAACGEKSTIIVDTTKTTVVIEVADFGDITVELYPRLAPQTVYRFQLLVQTGFYDGLTFHRIIPGFMIQGGDPLGNGTGGYSEPLYGEFSANGYTKNTLKHTRGTLSMARSIDNDSASSQFFIVHEDSPNLNGNYAAFARVTEGMDVVDAIASVATDLSENPGGKPLQSIVITRMYFKTTAEES